MCKLLGVTRSLVYYKPKGRKVDAEAENAVIEEFTSNRGVYGTRKLCRALKRRAIPLTVSRRRIGKIMKKYGLVSAYVKRRKKSKKSVVNEENKPNIVNREFNERKALEVVVSDLTYIKVAGIWHYICLLIDLCAREIIGFAAGRNKDAKLVRKAFYRINGDLRDIDVFHTDRGSEFKNEIIDDIISAFGMKRSLSAKGTPCDNAVSESMYNILKTEMAYGKTFETLDDLELELFQFVNWYNNKRLHGALGYLTPVEFKTNIS
jgi:transposase InsO family protein